MQVIGRLQDGYHYVVEVYVCLKAWIRSQAE